jgi:hypothetical protein
MPLQLWRNPGAETVARDAYVEDVDVSLLRF